MTPPPRGPHRRHATPRLQPKYLAAWRFAISRQQSDIWHLSSPLVPFNAAQGIWDFMIGNANHAFVFLLHLLTCQQDSSAQTLHKAAPEKIQFLGYLRRRTDKTWNEAVSPLAKWLVIGKTCHINLHLPIAMTILKYFVVNQNVSHSPKLSVLPYFQTFFGFSLWRSTSQCSRFCVVVWSRVCFREPGRERPWFPGEWAFENSFQPLPQIHLQLYPITWASAPWTIIPLILPHLEVFEQYSSSSECLKKIQETAGRL